MAPTLLIADRSYSSWSLRGWLLFDAFGLPVRTDYARLYTEQFRQVLAHYAPASTVPVAKFDDGALATDSLAIAEELASRHPEAGLWPTEPRQRAAARSLAAEMHSGFRALREACPMNLRRFYPDFPLPEPAARDVARIERLWDHARALSGSTTPWLFGAYSAADAFFAPVAARIAGYGLTAGRPARAYVAAHLAHPSFRRWRAMGLAEGPDQTAYDFDLPVSPWPGPDLLAAEPCEGPAENADCPYSGKPVTHFLRLRGRVFGFCNAFCRDKTAADPEAWPQFMALL